MALNIVEELTAFKQRYLFTPALLLLDGPLLYWFVVQLIYPQKVIKKQHLFHLVPFVIALFLTTSPQLVIAAGTVSQMLYVTLSLALIHKYHKTTSIACSDAHSLNIRWLTTVIILFVGIEAIDLLRLNFQPFISLELNLMGQLFENTAILLLSSFAIFKGVKNTALFDEMEHYETLTKTDSQQTDSDIYRVICETVQLHIVEYSLHHQPRLSLQDVATSAGLTIREISRAINQTTGQSFCDYINGLRVEDFKHRLCHDSATNATPQPLLQIAYDVGFNSKSSFNLIFKRETGITPSQYAKQKDPVK